jgi:hypothetical protein
MGCSEANTTSADGTSPSGPDAGRREAGHQAQGGVAQPVHHEHQVGGVAQQGDAPQRIFHQL